MTDQHIASAQPASTGPSGGPALGRRERAKLEKRQRLFDAAGDLFTRRGYDAVTTREIADAADVGIGTLFRYFPTKADILVAVMTDQIREGIDQAIAVSRAGADPVVSIEALVAPVARVGAAQPENVAAYLRETLFGPPHLRAASVAQGMAMPEAIEQILRHYSEHHPVREDVDLRDIADAIYAMVWFEGIKTITQGLHVQTDRAHHIVGFLIDGLLRTGPDGRHDSDTSV